MQKEIEQVMSTKLLLFPKFQSVVAILNFIEMKNEGTLPLIPFLGEENYEFILFKEGKYWIWVLIKVI